MIVTLLFVDIAQKKSRLREDVRHRLQSFSHRECLAESRSLCQRLHDLLPRGPQVIAAYFPLKDEADIRPLLTDLLHEGHHLYLPRVESGKMLFRRAPNLANLPPGAFRIPEPPIEAPLLEAAKLQIALIPGRAFDRTGNRLGRGNGRYDHWICDLRSLNPKTIFWGVCFECQLVQEVPSEPHDERMDAIVTARGFLEMKNEE